MNPQGQWQDVQKPQQGGDEGWTTVQSPASATPGQHWADRMGYTDPAQRAAVDFMEGAASGLASTVFHGGDIIRRALGMHRVIQNPDVQQAMTPPSTLPGQVGKFAEQAAEYAVPAGMVSKAMRGATLVPAAVKMVAQALPAAGVAALQTGGNPQAAGTAALLGAAGEGLGAILPTDVNGTPTFHVNVTSRLNPREAAAVQYAEGAGLPVDVTTASGSPMLKAAKKAVSTSPGASDILKQADEAAQSAYRQHATKLANAIGPGSSASRVGAGAAAASKLSSALDSIRQEESNAWNSLRSAAQSHTEVVQSGSRTTAILDSAGNPISVPTTKTIAAPVVMRDVKSAIAPIAARMENTIPEAQRQASPGYQLVKQILDSPDTVDLTTALDNLSAVKAIARGGNELPQVVGMSQGIAKAVTSPMHEAVRQSIEKNLGQDGIDLWNKARQLTTLKKSIGQSFKQSTLANPVGLVRKLTASEDAGLPILQKIQDVAPGAMPDVARATFEGMIERPKAGGGFTRIDGAIAKWDKIGPETKKILFGDNAENIGNFLQFVKMAQENVNPSGTGPLITAIDNLHSLRHPVSFALRTMGSRQLAKVLSSPNGVEMVRDGLKLPVGPQAIAAAKALRSIGSASTTQMLGESQASRTAAATAENEQPPQNVWADLPEGEHDFANGQTWAKSTDGTARRIR